MPGNEGGDRVHNFFQQGNFSQGHHQPQTIDENWSGFHSSSWQGNERQTSGLVNSKNYNAPKPGGESGQGDPLPFGQYGLNYASPNPRPDVVKNQLQNQQLILNGFGGGSQVLRTIQNEANDLQMDAETERHNLTRVTSVPESQQRSGPQHNNLVSASFGSKESPSNFDFFGSQHQMSGQYSGTPHPLPRQQSGMGDRQLSQQQVLLKHMQELQRKLQMEQLEAMQRHHMGPVHPFSNQGAGNHAPTFINGTPMHDPSSYPWISQVMNGNTNWVQQRASPSGQVYSNGLMISPEQGNQALRFMGVLPQQASQSLYGVPVSGSQSGAVASQVGKAMMHQMPMQGNSSFSPNENPSFSKERNLQEGNMLSRQGYEGSVSYGHASRQDTGGVSNVDSFNEMQQLPPNMGRRHDVAVSMAPTFPDQSAKLSVSSQETVALDPTEEKILFGSDDNIWEAFGGSLTESTECQNQSEAGFPSTQSGSWSALMQSAVAEASSSDEGKQGEWSGVGLQSSGSIAGKQQLPTISDGGKQLPSWIGNSQMASLSSRPLTSDSRLSSNYHKSGLQQPYLRQSKDTQQIRPVHHSSEETRKLLESSQPKMVAHGSMANDLAYAPGDYSSKNSPNRWNHQETIFSAGDHLSRSGNYVKSETNNVGTAFENQAKWQGNDVERGMNTNSGISGGMTMLGSLPNTGLDIGRQQINSKGVLSNISASQTSKNAHHEFWRTGHSAMRPGTDDSMRYLPQLERVMPQVLESPVKSSDRGSAEMHDVKGGNHRENSCDSHSSNLSNHASAGGLRENIWPDATDRHGLPGSKQNSIGQINQITTPSPRRFQYHPMGEVDVDMNQSYGTKNTLPSNALPHNFYGMLKSQEGRSRFVNTTTSNSAETEKASSVQKQPRDIRASCGASSGATSPGLTPTASAPVGRYGGVPSPCNSDTSSNQNMLELLQKVDQSKEPHTLSRFGSSDLIRSSNANEAVDAGFGAKQSSSSTSSQGFGLQLAPPSQGLRAPPHMMMVSQNLPQTNSPDPRHVSDKGGKMHVWLSSGASSQPLPSVYPSNQGESNYHKSVMKGKINADTIQHNMQMNTPANYASGFGEKSCVLQNLQITDSSTYDLHNVSASQAEFGQPIRADRSGAKVSMQQMAMMDSVAPFQPAAARRMHHKGDLSSMIPNMWTNMMNQQQSLGAQSASSDMLKTSFHPNGIPGTSGINFHQNLFEKDVPKKVDALSTLGFVGTEEQMLPGKQLDPTQRTPEEFEAKDANLTNVSRPDSGIAQKGVVALGYTMPNSGVTNSYSLGHQAESIKDIDPNNRQVKRFKGAEHGMDHQESLGMLHQSFSAGSSNTDGNLSANHASGDAKILSFSPEPSSEREKHTQAQGTLHKGLPVQAGLPKLSDNSMTPQISLQMAPTWFKQFGTLKNGQLLSVHDAQRAQAAPNTDQQFIPGKDPKDNGSDRLTVHQPNAFVDSDRMVNAWSTSNSYISSQQLSSLHPLASGFATGIVDSLRPKKRKSVVADLLPWHKEVASSSQRRLPNISMAEHEWARVAHHLFEKIEDEVNANADSTPVHRARRRLMLTSQLMQQIFRPPPQSILALDASSECEAMTFFAARLALGDACSLVCQSDGNSSASQEGGNQSSVLESVNRISYQYLTKVSEDFISRASVLENEFLRLDRRASFLDLRLESQELERFSVINRFARFHGRNQAEGAEGSSASDQATAVQRVGPLRYVNAYPEPKSLPERAQCFTL